MKKWRVSWWVRNNFGESSREVAIEVFAESAEDAELAIACIGNLCTGDMDVTPCLE